MDKFSSQNNGAVDAAHKPAMNDGSPFDEFVEHRVEAMSHEYDLEPGPALDEVRRAYVSGLSAGFRQQPDRVEVMAQRYATKSAEASNAKLQRYCAAMALGLRESHVTLGEIARAYCEAGLDE